MTGNSRITLIIVFIIVLAGDCSSQGTRIDNILAIYGQTAYSYLLSANRPWYGVDASIIEKGKGYITLNASYSDGTFDFPLSGGYGLTDNIELMAGIYPYTESYNFLGNKITSVGDSYAGMKYSFGESEHFIYAVQGLIKIPTASSSKELGTGKVDLLFGIAQGYVNKIFGFDLGFEFNLLHRRDFPNTRKYSPAIQNHIDSLKSAYNYVYEPEFIITGGPSYDFTDSFSGYLGVSFSRNTKLNYNTTSTYLGMAYALSNNVSLTSGLFYGLEETGAFGISGGVFYSF